MNSNWNKNIYRSLLILSFIGINVGLLFGISSVWVYLNSGADKASILHIEGGLEATYVPEIIWQNTENPGRPMEKQTLLEIQEDYLKAWYVRNVAYATNDTYGISDYYTDSLRSKLAGILQINKEAKTKSYQTTLSHHPSLDFYSTDGTLVVFTDEQVEIYQELWQDEKLVAKKKDTSSFKVMMLLEDGFWRIRHLVTIKEANGSTIKNKRDKNYNGIVQKSKGLNYYPSKSAWNTFGVNFNEAIISKDFSQLQEMGLNMVRIFVPYEEFGKAAVNSAKLIKLNKLLDIADKYDIKVLVTLFDFYGNYELMDWTLTHRHAETIVSALKDHPALFGWDIKNEPDLDFESRTKEKVLAWLEEMIIRIRAWDPQHPVTIGWSSAAAAPNMAKQVDFVSFHYYLEPSEFAQTYKALRKSVGGKPILLSEYGYSSYSGFWNLFTGSEKQQASYYEVMQAQLNKEEIPFLFWTMYDFDEVPNTVVGNLPWRKQRQKYFGIISVDGERKPAFEYLDQSGLK